MRLFLKSDEATDAGIGDKFGHRFNSFRVRGYGLEYHAINMVGADSISSI